MNNFDFTIGKIDVPIINLTANGLSFNEACISALGYPEYINIGFDRQTKKLAIKASDRDNKFYPYYRFVTNETKRKRVCLTASRIRTEIIRITEMKPNRKGIKYIAEYDKTTEMLVVDLIKHIEN